MLGGICWEMLKRVVRETRIPTNGYRALSSNVDSMIAMSQVLVIYKAAAVYIS